MAQGNADGLVPYKNSIICDVFEAPADADYALSRWAFFNLNSYHFHWNAAQAIEKYCKAIILLNEIDDVRNYGHDVLRLYKKIKKFCGELFPEELTCPSWHPKHSWVNEETQKFVQRISELGSEHNRYNYYHSYRTGNEVYKLDILVYFLKRVCVSLDCPFGGRSGVLQNLPTHREILQRAQNCSTNAVRFAGIPKDIRGSEAWQALVFSNHTFFPEEAGSRIPRPMGARNSMIHIRIFQDGNIDQDTDVLVRVSGLIDWLLKSIRLSGEDQRELIGKLHEINVELGRRLGVPQETKED